MPCNKHILYRFFSILMLTAVSAFSLYAQNTTFGKIAGKISDAKSHDPIEGAIIYLSNTDVGVSSTKNGTFLLKFIPPGTYTLVVARLGYDRQSLSVRLKGSDSVYIPFLLVPNPIKTPEVEITGKSGERRLKEKFNFFPPQDSGMYCVYSQISKIPIGVFFEDSALYMYTLESTVIDSQKYLRVWLLYQNLSRSVYDFNPARCVVLSLTGKGKIYKDIPPDPPSKISTQIDHKKITQDIMANVGDPLRTMAIRRSQFVLQEERFPAIVPIWEMKAQPPADDGTLSSRLYSRVFTKSTNAGILQRYTVYPQSSVNGFLYFPFPDSQSKTSGTDLLETYEYRYKVIINTPEGKRTIDFIPN
ncbi:MAG: carboxypeptidase-like regulatory domain-containing protein [Bacteroidota bacterium]